MKKVTDDINYNKGHRKPFSRLLVARLFIVASLASSVAGAKEPFLNLDSIAKWGKFPAFCVRTYRWGDKFFNGYDSIYVQGSGYRMNAKVKVDSWSDIYDFRFSDHYRMMIDNRPSTSVGLWLTYMAVSVGYDMNVSKYFSATTGARKRWDFQFNCMLFGAEFYSVNNDVDMTISRHGYPGAMQNSSIPFHGFHSDSWGVNLYYFFNHKHYSQAAAFNYSKIQVRSSGSMYAGFAYWSQNYSLDFSEVAPQLGQGLPEPWKNHYRVGNRNYALKLGYGYNWVFHRGWVLGVSCAPMLGVRVGYITNEDSEKPSFAMSNRLKFSTIYNNPSRRWFFGLVGTIDSGLIYDKTHTFLTNNISVELSAGFRFDLW